MKRRIQRQPGTTMAAALCAMALLVGCAACGAPAPGTTGAPESAAAQTDTSAAETTGTVPAHTTQAETTAANTTQAGSAAQGTDTESPKEGRLQGLEPVAAFSKTFADGYDGFALELIQRTQQEGKNGFVSPASVYLALGMTANGAAGKTAEELYAALGVTDGDALNRGCRDLQSRLTDNTFRLANGIWINQEKARDILPAFIAANREYFGAQLAAAPFDAALTKEINSWVADNTAGRIRDLLKEPLDPEGRMVLVNTLLFEDAWQVPFTKVEESIFHGAQEDVTLPFMYRMLVGKPYYEDAQVQATRVPFSQADVSMLFVLPKTEGAAALDSWIKNLTAEQLRALVSSTDTTPKLELTVPRCKLSYDESLAGPLQEMGIRAAFDAGRADFSRLTADGGVYIGDVPHRTELEMDEKGVLAAAATGVTLRGVALRPPEDEGKVMRLDRPFFCAIVDNATGAVLFGGAVSQPRQ